MQQGSGISRGKAVFKSGKLIKIDAVFNAERIERIKITGDFFLHPEEKIEELENALLGVELKDVEKVTARVLKNAEYVGIDVSSIAKTVEEAWKRRQLITSENTSQ